MSTDSELRSKLKEHRRNLMFELRSVQNELAYARYRERFLTGEIDRFDKTLAETIEVDTKTQGQAE